MGTQRRYVQFWSRRSIVSLIGVDYNVLEKTGHDNISKFYLTGAFVISILLISFCSVFYAFDLMFNMWYAELLLSSFFALMFFNIYIFLIQTFSKQVMPHAHKYPFFNLSNLSRLGFVLLIGYLIAQPVRIYSYKDRLETDISHYKHKLYNDFQKANSRLYKKDIANLFAERNRLIALSTGDLQQPGVARIDSTVNELTNSIAVANEQAKANISEADFFVKRIKLAAAYHGSGMIVLVVIVVFMAPVALIYSISGESEYYKLKKSADQRLVLLNYARFKLRYQKLLLDKFDLQDVNFYEPYADPPFNTIRKGEPAYLGEKDFFKAHP